MKILDDSGGVNGIRYLPFNPIKKGFTLTSNSSRSTVFFRVVNAVVGRSR
ncbi:hypothetical protein [Altericista sp. CCNU0014]